MLDVTSQAAEAVCRPPVRAMSGAATQSTRRRRNVMASGASLRTPISPCVTGAAPGALRTPCRRLRLTSPSSALRGLGFDTPGRFRQAPKRVIPNLIAQTAFCALAEFDFFSIFFWGENRCGPGGRSGRRTRHQEPVFRQSDQRDTNGALCGPRTYLMSLVPYRARHRLSECRALSIPTDQEATVAHLVSRWGTRSAPRPFIRSHHPAPTFEEGGVRAYIEWNLA